MRVLVTGGAGFIGSHTAKLLAQAGYEPVVYDNMSQGHPWAVRWGTLVEGDLADSSLLLRTLWHYRIEGVIHFAARAYVGESMHDPAGYFQANVTNSLSLLGAMRRAEVNTIVFSSSCAVYGKPLHLPLNEDHPTDPLSPYGESKLFISRALRWYGEAHGMRWIALRYFNAAGSDPEGEIGEEHDPETHLIPLAMGAALDSHEPLIVNGNGYPTPDGTAVRDYVHVMDLARAHVLALQGLRNGVASQNINLGTGTGHSILDVIRTVEEVSGRRVPALMGPPRPGDAAALVADNRRAAEVLGWAPEYPRLQDMVETAWEWRASQRVMAAR